MGESKEGDILNIRVVLRGVRDDVVDIVATLPPTEGKSSAEIGNEGSNERVDDKVVGDAHVAGVVGGEGQLMPETAHEQCRELEILVPEKYERERKEREVPAAFPGVGPVVALIKSSCPYSDFELAIFFDNLRLGQGVDWWVFLPVVLELLQSDPVLVVC